MFIIFVASLNENKSYNHEDFCKKLDENLFKKIDGITTYRLRK